MGHFCLPGSGSGSGSTELIESRSGSVTLVANLLKEFLTQDGLGSSLGALWQHLTVQRLSRQQLPRFPQVDAPVFPRVELGHLHLCTINNQSVSPPLHHKQSISQSTSAHKQSISQSTSAHRQSISQSTSAHRQSISQSTSAHTQSINQSTYAHKQSISQSHICT